MRLPFTKPGRGQAGQEDQAAGAPARANVGDRVTDGLTYQGIAYRYDADVVFLAFQDTTADAEGRPFTVWCAAPHRFAVRLDDGRVVDMTVDRLEGEAIDLRLHAMRRAAP